MVDIRKTFQRENIFQTDLVRVKIFLDVKVRILGIKKYHSNLKVRNKINLKIKVLMKEIWKKKIEDKNGEEKKQKKQ